MVVGVCRLALIAPGSHSLKEKRMVLRRMKDLVRNKFNVSVAEVEAHELWQTAVLAAACVGVDRAYVNGVLDQLLHAVGRERDLELVRSQMEFV